MLLKTSIIVLLAIAAVFVVRMFLPSSTIKRLRHHRKSQNGKVCSTTRPLTSSLEQPPIEKSPAVTNNGTSIHPYHSVTLEGGLDCCEAMQQIKHKRYLSADAPTIPIKGCDKADCHCHYQHFEDRRQPDSDRRIDYGVTQDLYGAFGEQNRRVYKKGRRETD